MQGTQTLTAQTWTLSLSQSQDQEAALDAQIATVMDALRGVTEHPANKPYLYVTDEDITGLPCFAQVRGASAGGQPIVPAALLCVLTTAAAANLVARAGANSAFRRCCLVPQRAAWSPTPQDTIFAVKAPKGTTLEMPDPNEAALMGGPRHYR